MTILNETNRAALLTYRYKGGDTSPIYAHVLSPFAQFWVDFMPTWVAPNAITLSGLSLPLAMSVLSVLYNPSMGQDAPSWLALWSAISLFIYQTMDNMDGKQARKIGASSPLGMLFDHVCDAINAGTSCLFVGSFLGAGWDCTFWFTILAFVPFHMQTWEEFYRQEMVLPMINGPSEGILMIIGLALFSFVNGASWWQEPYNPFGEKQIASIPALANLNTRFICAFSFFVAFAASTVLLNSWTVLKIVVKEGGSVVKALMSLMPFVAFIVSVIMWKLHSAVIQKHPLLSVLLIIAVFVEGVSHVMLSHIVEDEIKPSERMLSWMMIGMALNVCFTPYGQPLVDERLLLIPYFITAVSVTAISLSMICQESASALNIYVFRVGKRDAQKKQN